jgi:tRNA(Ile)-lysidine synthase TilS/MesJ
MIQDTLVKKIKSLGNNSEFDCLLMFSGGKDSSYLLYHLSEVLKLKVATVTLVHDFLPKETISNIEQFASRYARKHISVPNTVLNHSGKHFLETWINKPDEGSLITLCTGCRLGLIKPIIDTARAEKIKVVISGHTPFEESNYKINLVNYPKGKKGSIFFAIGYLRLLIRNPSLLKSIKAFINQAKEFYYYKNKKDIYAKHDLTLLNPFYNEVPYDEAGIVKKLKELNWVKPASTTNNSYWRSDCNMYAIRHYFYNQVAGYNEMKEYYGKLFDSKLITEEYLQEHTDKHYEKEEIMDLLTSLELSESSLDKYRDFIGKYANHDIAYPACGSCKGLGR